MNGSNKCHEVSVKLENVSVIKMMKELSNLEANPFNFTIKKRFTGCVKAEKFEIWREKFAWDQNFCSR